jgi:hypothetical protein
VAVAAGSGRRRGRAATTRGRAGEPPADRSTRLGARSLLLLPSDEAVAARRRVSSTSTVRTRRRRSSGR